MSERGAVVVGASSGVGRALAEALAADGWALAIAARSKDDLERLARDLRIRHRATVSVAPIDITAPDEELETFVAAVVATLPRLDAVLIPAGAVADVDEGTDDWSTTTMLLETNLLGVVKLAGRFVTQFERSSAGGTVVLFSSIAAAVPRRRNVAYAAAKAGLETYGRSMRHRLADSDVAVQVYALGYVDTAMSRGQDLLLPAADPARVARRVVAGLADGSTFRYEPRYWRPIVKVLGMLPWTVYKRLRF